MVESMSPIGGHPPDARDRLYASYVSTHAGTGGSHADVALLRQVLPLLPEDSNARILDIGCGAGEVIRLLHARGQIHACGVDASAQQTALAAERGIHGVRQGDLFEVLQDEPGGLDAVIALDVMEHFAPEEVMQLLDAIYAALRPGGVFVGRTPNAVSPFGGRYRYGDLTHGISFTPRSLRQGLATAGFSSCLFRPVNPVPHGVASAVRFATWLGIASLLKVVLAVETGQVRDHIVTQNMILAARR
jgi:2-polyprenyl-3-methyl-5-hydroxy-6-metoxy-1,4-benzoquinol methylase